jgi:zinc protease
VKTLRSTIADLQLRHLCLLTFALCTLTSSTFALPLFRDSLPSGLVVLTYEDHHLPTASIALVCRSGHEFDPSGKDGTAGLTARLLARGTKTVSGDSITSIIDFLGASFEGGASTDNSQVSVRCLSKDLGTALDLLADALLNPVFDAQEFAVARDQALQGARRAGDYPGWQVNLEFDKLLFGTNPQGTPDNGDTLTIPRITREDLVAFHKTHYVPNNCFLVAVGDIDRTALARELNTRLGKWQAAAVPASNVTPPAYPDRIKVKLIARPDMNQTYVVLGHPGIKATDPDMLATRLMSYILGGSAMSSRLGIVVREEAGLAYDVNAYFDRGKLQGAFRSSVETNRPKPAIEKMLAVIKTMCDSGATAAELLRAHNYYTGSFPLTYSSSGGKMAQVVNLELHHFGLDWLDKYPDRIKAVRLEQVNKAARDHIRPGQYYMVIIGNITKDDLGLTDVDWLE